MRKNRAGEGSCEWWGSGILLSDQRDPVIRWHFGKDHGEARRGISEEERSRSREQQALGRSVTDALKDAGAGGREERAQAEPENTAKALAFTLKCKGTRLHAWLWAEV